jgi:ankyrin repeat protein
MSEGSLGKSVGYMSIEDPLAIEAVEAIQSGNVKRLRQLLKKDPALATVRLGDGSKSRTLLHVATDWPGNFLNGSEIVAILVASGADVNARIVGPHHAETALHWAASSDDAAVLDALLDLGADLEAGGGVIGNGTPIADATAFGQWKAARRLIERGAKTTLWQAASLGLMDRVAGFFVGDSMPSSDDVTAAFWCACHGGQQQAAEYLLGQGADLNWIGYDQLTPLDAARRSKAPDLVEWLSARGAKSASALP